MKTNIIALLIIALFIGISISPISEGLIKYDNTQILKDLNEPLFDGYITN